MQKSFFFPLLCLLIVVTSCKEDGVTTVDLTPSSSYELTTTAPAVEFPYAYELQRTEGPSNRLEHQLLLTSEPVLESGAFSGTTEALIITHVTDMTYGGNFRYVGARGGNRSGYGAIRNVQYYENFDANAPLTAAEDYVETATIRIEDVDGERQTTVTFQRAGHDDAREIGFRGTPVNVQLDAAAFATARAINADNRYVYSGDENEFSTAYLITTGTMASSVFYRIVLSEDRVHNEALEMTGTSDIVLPDFVVPGGLKDGVYEIGAEGEQTFVSLYKARSRHGAYCREMNYATGRADLDDWATEPRAYLEIEGDRLTVEFTIDHGDEQTVGTYAGTVIRTN